MRQRSHGIQFFKAVATAFGMWSGLPKMRTETHCKPLLQVAKTFDMPEHLKLQFIKEIGYTHLRITQVLYTIRHFSFISASLKSDLSRLTRPRGTFARMMIVH